jgi:uncharacterized protein (TIGR02646 family)
MKFINKNIKNEPSSLKKYKATTPNATYSGLSKKEVQDALLEEQGYICAYCMGRISHEKYDGPSSDIKPMIGIEHFIPQAKSKAEEKAKTKKLELDYLNMLGVCNGSEGKEENKKSIQHCDKTGEIVIEESKQIIYGKMCPGVELKKLDPRKKKLSEDLLTYSSSGKIKSINQDIDVEEDILRLNLNAEHLINARKQKMDAILSKIKAKKNNTEWTKSYLSKFIPDLIEKKAFSFVNTDGERVEKKGFIPYHMAAVWFINTLISKPQYK